MKTKYIILGGLLAVISAILQCIPAFLSEAFIFLTILSTIPIYIIAKKQPVLGILSYIITFILISFISPHENIMFIFTNGILGLSLGICNYFTDKKRLICSISAILLTISICIVNFIIGINIIGFSFNLSLLPIVLIFLGSSVYSFIFLVICRFFYKRINISNF